MYLYSAHSLNWYVLLLSQDNKSILFNSKKENRHFIDLIICFIFILHKVAKNNVRQEHFLSHYRKFFIGNLKRMYSDHWSKDFLMICPCNLRIWTRPDHKRIRTIRTREMYRRAITSIMTCGDMLCSDYRSGLLEIRVGACKFAI